MIRDYYSCDGGSICVKCGDSFVKFPNSIGDGFYKVYVMSADEFSAYKEDHKQYNIKYNYVSYSIFNNAEILDDDCIDSIDRYADTIANGYNPIIFVISGRTEVYEAAGKFYFINY